jgi:CheY-like chemotaxis protein
MFVSNLKALIVDDDPATLRVLEHALKICGVLSITSAVDGQEAHKIVSQGPDAFDIVVCDWIMPNMDGLAFLQFFRLTHPKTPFVMLTTKSDATDFHLAKKMGVDFFFMKPLSADDVSIRLKSVLELRLHELKG